MGEGTDQMADAKKPRAAFSPWDRRELPGSFSVEETARKVERELRTRGDAHETAGGRWLGVVFTDRGGTRAFGPAATGCIGNSKQRLP